MTWKVIAISKILFVAVFILDTLSKVVILWFFEIRNYVPPFTMVVLINILNNDVKLSNKCEEISFHYQAGCLKLWNWHLVKHVLCSLQYGELYSDDILLSNHLPCYRIEIVLPGWFQVDSSPPTGWTHFVLNYLGPNIGEGIWIYYNGNQVASQTTRYTYLQHPAGEGRIVIGRAFPDQDRDYASLQVDELIFFNQSLSDNEIKQIYNAA